MTDLAVLTPCFRGDAELFGELHRSVLEFTSPDTVHHVLVPLRDQHLFRPYEGPRCKVWVRSEFLPPRYLRAPFTDVYVNVRQPYPPLRGWVMQQTAKIAASAQLDARVILVVDSDAVLIRPTTVDRFMVNGEIALYRIDQGVTAPMTRHVIWHDVSRRLLGLPAAPPPPLPDYVTPMSMWDPAVVRAMQQRVAEVTGRSWLDAFNGERHISEFMLYGVFVEEVLRADGPKPPTDDSVVYNYYSRTPLDHDSARIFAEKMPADSVAVMISSKSGTPDDVRQAAIQRCRDLAADPHRVGDAP